MTSAGPVVAITAMSKASAQPYVDLVQRCGGSPWVVLPDHRGPPEETLRRAGALLVANGTALDAIDKQTIERTVIALAVDSDFPLIAVGTGFHTLNVAMGGAGPVPVEGHAPQIENGQDKASYHRIYIAPGSKLAAIVGSGGFVRVNSLHRLGIREAHKSRDLMASAYGLEDGVIEGLESPDHDLIIGIQFQPERKLEIPPHFDRLFQLLVERAAR